MLVRLPVEPRKRLAEYLELGLAVPLEDSGVVLPQSLCHEVIGDPACAESRCERVTQLVQREILDTRALERGLPSLPHVRDVRTLAVTRRREWVFCALCLGQLTVGRGGVYCSR